MQVWTSTSTVVRKKLSDDCVDEVFEKARDAFKELNFNAALTILLRQYL